MKIGLGKLIAQNIKRNKKTFGFCVFGIALGIGMFSFFLAMGDGVRENVLNKIYPLQQVELEPQVVSFLGIQGAVRETALSRAMVQRVAELPGVTRVYPKTKSHFPARLFGGKELFGDILRAEAFLDGMDDGLIREDLPPEQADKFRDRGHFIACEEAVECGPTGVCRMGQCWDRRCGGGEEGQCGASQACIRSSCTSHLECGEESGACDGGTCRVGFCGDMCVPGEDGPCGLGRHCLSVLCDAKNPCAAGECRAGECVESGYCDAIACELDDGNSQIVFDRPARGETYLLCEGEECEEPIPCPKGTWCVPHSILETEGHCEAPIPVVLSPFLVEIFNLTSTAAFGLDPVDDPQELVGLRFHIQMGNSYVGDDEDRSKQVTRKAEVIGFSEKALQLGVTVPQSYVTRSNTRYRGEEFAEKFDTVLVEVAASEDVQGLLDAVGPLGLQLTARSNEAEQAANLLFLLTLGFALISWVILGVASVNISQTFMMTVMERRRELGIFRSIGATRSDLRKLVLGEAVLVGVVGALLGVGASWSAGVGVDWLLNQVLGTVVFRPDSFFSFSWGILGSSLAVAVVFCALGAWPPANRAAKLDPAIVTR